MTWDRFTRRLFRMVPKDPKRSDFHAPYNRLLFSLFPVDALYMIAPLWKPDAYPALYFRFEITHAFKPILLLELKEPGDLQYSSKRQEGIRQVQVRLRNLARQYYLSLPHLFSHNPNYLGSILAECPLPELHAVCIFGTKVCFCKLDRNQDMQPSFTDARPEGTTDLAPLEYWDCDILEEEGEKRFKAMVEEIKQACEAL